MIEDRYWLQRPYFGEDGQDRIIRSTVAVIGCGGLGINVLTALAQAGVSHFIIYDAGFPEITDINHQYIYAMADVRPKASLAGDWILAINPFAEVEAHHQDFDESSADAVSMADVVVDCSEDVRTSKKIRGFCIPGKTLITASLQGDKGVVSVVPAGCSPRDTGDASPDKTVAVGVCYSVVGSIQALECLKILSGKETPSGCSVVTVDLNDMTMSRVCNN